MQRSMRTERWKSSLETTDIYVCMQSDDWKYRFIHWSDRLQEKLHTRTHLSLSLSVCVEVHVKESIEMKQRELTGRKEMALLIFYNVL